MWTVGRRIASIVPFSLVVFMGVASAQYYNYPAAPQPARPSGQSTYTVDIAMATVHGTREKILTDARGMALYYFTTDTPTKAACTGECAKMWPPLLSTSTPTHGTALPGKLDSVNDGNGPQVRYNDHLLYAYSADTTPGQAAGDGLYGKWFVVTPNLAVSVSGSPGGTSGSNTGGGW
jgi:predicted lipoprotein with Yx(FWY)xxD motif